MSEHKNIVKIILLAGYPGPPKRNRPDFQCNKRDQASHNKSPIKPLNSQAPDIRAILFPNLWLRLPSMFKKFSGSFIRVNHMCFFSWKYSVLFLSVTIGLVCSSTDSQFNLYIIICLMTYIHNHTNDHTILVSTTSSKSPMGLVLTL